MTRRLKEINEDKKGGGEKSKMLRQKNKQNMLRETRRTGIDGMTYY